MPKLTLHNAYHYALCIMAFSFSFPFTLFPIGIALLAFTGVFLRIKEKNKAVDKRLAIFYVILFSYIDRKSTRLNSSHVAISYAVFCLKKKKLHKQCLS